MPGEANRDLAAKSVAVVIPALNEQESIGRVIASIPPWIKQVIVVDNGSTDATAERARQAGAVVITEPWRGYGQACLAGCAAAGDANIVVFLDGDLSDYPERMNQLVRPIVEGRADFVLGSRTLGSRQKGALLPQQRFGGWLAWPAHPAVVALSLHRSGAVPRHPHGKSGTSEHGRSKFWLDGSDADSCGGRGLAHSRSSNRLSLPHRAFQNIRHIPRCDHGGNQNLLHHRP